MIILLSFNKNEYKLIRERHEETEGERAILSFSFATNKLC